MDRLDFLQTNLFIFGIYLLVEHAGCIFLLHVLRSGVFELVLDLLIQFLSGVDFLSDLVDLFLYFPIFLVFLVDLVSQHVKSVDQWSAFSFLKQFIFASSSCRFGRDC